MSTLKPTLLDVLQLALDIDRASMFVALPGRVVSYDAAAQTVVVQPAIKRVSRNADDERLVDSPQPISDVPVEWPRGGGYFMSMPLVAGDEGLIVFADTHLGAWRESGEVSDPGYERLHGLAGAVFRPGLCSVARVLTDATAGHLVLGKDGGGPQIHIDASTVQLGGAGGQFVALANLVSTQLSSLKSAISGAAVVAGDGGAAFKTNLITALSAWPGPVAATKVKAT